MVKYISRSTKSTCKIDCFLNHSCSHSTAPNPFWSCQLRENPDTDNMSIASETRAYFMKKKTPNHWRHIAVLVLSENGKNGINTLLQVICILQTRMEWNGIATMWKMRRKMEVGRSNDRLTEKKQNNFQTDIGGIETSHFKLHYYCTLAQTL